MLFVADSGPLAICCVSVLLLPWRCFEKARWFSKAGRTLHARSAGVELFGSEQFASLASARSCVPPAQKPPAVRSNSCERFVTWGELAHIAAVGHSAFCAPDSRIASCFVSDCARSLTIFAGLCVSRCSITAFSLLARCANFAVISGGKAELPRCLGKRFRFVMLLSISADYLLPTSDEVCLCPRT